MWNYLVYVVCFLLGVFSVIKEYRRTNKQRLVLRVIASLLALSALAAIALPISYWTEATLPGNEAVLLTAGFSKDSLNKFKNETLYTADVDIQRHYSKAKFISLEQISKISPAIAKVHVLGNGLTKDELKELNNMPVIFHPDQKREGVVSINWTEKIKQGERFTIQGTFNHIGESQVRLVLKELNTTVDSATIERSGESKFELGSLPKSTGRLVDRLLVINGADTIANERLPMIIDPVKTLKILLLTAAPGFENKFLKDWLSAQGFGLAVRSEISKDKISTQFVNTEKMALEHLSASLLDKFDMVITDLSILKSLNKAENAALEQQVSENGLGLIIRADTILKSSVAFQNDFSLYQANAKDQKTAVLKLQGEKFDSKINETDQLFINNKDDLQSLVSDGQNRLLAGVILKGSGKAVCTTLNNTYSWMLAGNKTDYANFWSLLIGKAAKTTLPSESWSVITPLPAINTPVSLQLETAQQPREILIDNGRLSPIQNVGLPFQWQSTWWPGYSDWHSIQRSGGQVAWIYVYDTADWETVKASARISATKKYASVSALSDVTKQIHSKIKILVPKVYFYMLLLICCSFLWVEAKMQQN